MEAKENIPQELDDLAKKLESRDAMAASQLQRLSKALGPAKENVAAWAGLDLEKAFPPTVLAETLCEEDASHANLVKTVRNILIFLPLFFTWQALSNNQNLGQLSLTSIITIAPINLIIFAGLILLTFVHELFEMKVDRNQQHEMRQIADLLRRCTLQLSAVKSQSSIDFTLNFEKMGSQLLDQITAHKEAIDLVEQARKTEIVDLQGFIKDFKRGASDMKNAGNKLDAAVNNTASYIFNLDKSLVALNVAQAEANRASDDLKRALTAVVVHQQTTATQLADNSHQLKAAVDELKATYIAAQPMMKDMRDTTAGLAKVQPDFLDRMAKLVQDQQHTTQAMVALLDQINSAIAALNRATNSSTLPTALDGASSAVIKLQAEIEAFVREQGRSLQLLEEVNRSLKSVPVPIGITNSMVSRP